MSRALAFTPSRFAGEHVDAQDLVLARDAFLAGTAEGIEPLAQLDGAEPDPTENIE